MSNALNDGLSVPNQLEVIGTGSPLSYQNYAQVGTATASNAAVDVVFAEPFSSAPRVFLSLGASGAVAGYPTYQSAGSFGFIGTSGIDYNWKAIGEYDLVQ